LSEEPKAIVIELKGGRPMINYSRKIACLIAFVGLLPTMAIVGCTPESRELSLISDLNSGTPELRLYAVQTLGCLRSSRAVDSIAAALHDGDPAVRRCAVGALGQIRDHRSTEALRRAMRHGDPVVRRAALWTLSGRMDYGSDYGDLLNALADSLKPWNEETSVPSGDQAGIKHDRPAAIATGK